MNKLWLSLCLPPASGLGALKRWDIEEAPQRLVVPRLRLHGGWMEAVWDSQTVCEGLGLESV